MSNERSKIDPAEQAATVPELSEQDLDNVAGGVAGNPMPGGGMAGKAAPPKDPKGTRGDTR